MRTFGYICTGFLVLFLLIGSAVGFRWLGIEVDAWLLPKKEKVITDVYRNSESRVSGTLAELLKLQSEYYESNSEAHKGALKARIIRAAAEIDSEFLKQEPELYSFIQKLKSEGRNNSPFGK